MKHCIISIVCFILLTGLFPFSAYPFDYSLYTVKLNKYSEKVYSEEVSRFRIISTENEFTLPNTPFQRVLEGGWVNNIYTMYISSGILNLHSENSLEKYLINTRLLNLHDPEIDKISKKFKNSKNLISDVERFVFDFIEHKVIGIPIISASRIIKEKAGDCTEHTVLTVALLRSLGIPARALVGMILCREFGNGKNVFVYHMWTEAYKDGRWILVDATRPGLKHPNRYLALSYHHLKTETPLSYLLAVSAMRNFSVVYVKPTTGI